MKLETRQKLLKLPLGETLTIPWSEIPPNLGRPKDAASFGFSIYLFEAKPTDSGLEIRRVK